MKQIDSDYCTFQQASSLFDGVSCANPKRALSISTPLSALMKSYSSPLLTVDLWFRYNSAYSDGSLFLILDDNGLPLFQMQMLNSLLECTLSNQPLALFQAQNTQPKVGTWNHAACVLNGS